VAAQNASRTTGKSRTAPYFHFINHPFLWIMVGSLIGFFVYDRMFGSTCPACRERRALETTGGREPPTWTKDLCVLRFPVGPP
jgi:hypothetical protein